MKHLKATFPISSRRLVWLEGGNKNKWVTSQQSYFCVCLTPACGPKLTNALCACRDLLNMQSNSEQLFYTGLHGNADAGDHQTRLA